jgi:hypothetical protein
MAKKVQEKKPVMLEDKLDLDLWQARIDFTKTHTEERTRKRGFDRFEDYYRGDYDKHINIPKLGTITKINEVFAYVETDVDNLYIRDPYITINAQNSKSKLPAFIQEQAINGDWRRLKLKQESQKVIPDSDMAGRGWMKIGYKATGAPGVIDEEDLWAIHIPWRHIIYDPHAVDPPNDCMWICHWYDKSVEWLRKKYPDKKIEPTKAITVNDNIEKKLLPTDKDFTTVYEIWDKDTGYKLIYCEGCDEWLEQTKPIQKDSIGPYKIKGYPFYMLKFTKMTGDKDNFPISFVEVQEPQILEKLKLRTIQLEHLKRYGRQMAAKKDTLNEDNKDIYKQGVTGSIVEFEGDIPPVPISYPQLQSDIYAIEDKVDIDRMRVSGQPLNAQGSTMPTRTRTLGEVQNITQGASNRHVAKLDAFEDFMEDVACGLIGLQRQFYDTDRYVRILGRIPQEFLEQLQEEDKFDGVSIKFNKQDIQCDYDLDIKIGSSIPMNKQNRLNTLIQILKFGPALGLTPETQASRAVGKAIFKDLDLQEIEDAYNADLHALEESKRQGPSPQEKMKMAGQVQALKRGQADIDLKKVRTQKNKLDIAKDVIELTEGKEKSEKK